MKRYSVKKFKGWLRKINNPAGLGSDLFALELRYNAPGTSDALTAPACYNGNISEMLWNNNGTPKGYGFTYDGANGNMAYDPGKGVNIGYNELNLPQQVQFGANDNIRYTYDAAGRKQNSQRILLHKAVVRNKKLCGAPSFKVTRSTKPAMTKKNNLTLFRIDTKKPPSDRTHVF